MLVASSEVLLVRFGEDDLLGSELNFVRRDWLMRYTEDITSF